MRAVRVMTFVGLACVLVACSLGDRQAQADRVAEAVDATAALPLVEGTITANYSIEITRAEAVGLGIQGAPDEAEVRFQIQTDAASALVGPVDGGKEFPLVIFTDDTIFMRKLGAEDEARPWLEFRLDEMTEGDGELTETTFESGLSAAVLSVFDPRLLLDLAAGPLAGSIEEKGRQDIGGVSTTRYEANFDIPRVFDETRDEAYSDDQAEQAQTFLSLLAIDDDVHPGEVWVGADGTIRKFRITLELDVDRFIKFHLTLTMLAEPGSVPDVELTPPDRAETVTVQSLVRLERVAASTVSIDDTLGGLLGG